MEILTKMLADAFDAMPKIKISHFIKVPLHHSSGSFGLRLEARV